MVCKQKSDALQDALKCFPDSQTVYTRSTSGVASKSLGYNGSNELLGRSVASKLSAQQAGKKKNASGNGIS